MSKEVKHNFFVRRPVLAIVIAITTVIIGGVSILGLPLEKYPDITPPIVQVRANYTGASALTVENSVATPLEQQVNGVDNMIYMKSTNTNDGSMNIQVSFDVGTDPDMNTVFTQNRVSAATAKLPEEVKRLGVTTEKSLPNTLLLITLTSDNPEYDQNFLGNYALINIKDVLARIKGIGRVDILGASDYSMRIWIKPDVLAKLGITIPEIMNAIRSQNAIVPGGKFGDEPAPEGTEFTYTVRLPDRLVTEREFGEIVVRANEDGSQVRLRDIARVKLGVESYRAKTRINKESCAILAIYQAPGSNAVELAENVTASMDELALQFPEGMQYQVSLDATKPITAGIAEIIETLIIALILVILVVFIFIQDWRATLIPTLAIPVSLIGAFMLFPLLGFTINTLSLLGLVLAIGLVVDDAIVVIEAVQVNIESGMDTKSATSKAMKEVSAPVVATTLVLIAVFVPVAMISGITGSLYKQFAITLAVSVAFSSINALTLSPALCSLLLKKPKPYKGLLGKFFNKFNTLFEKNTEGYVNKTKKIGKRLRRGLVFVLIVVILTAVIGKLLPGGFIPEEDQGYLYVNLQLPPAASLQRSDAEVKKIEEILLENENVEYVTSVSGFSLLSGALSSNSGFLFITLKDWDQRSEGGAVNSLITDFNRRLYARIIQGQAFAFGPPAIPGLGNGTGFSVMVQDRVGNTPEYLEQNTNMIIQKLNEREEIASAFTTFQASVPQKQININRDKVLKTGVPLGDIYDTFGAFLGGAYVNDFNRFGRLYKAYVQAEPEYRQSEESLNLFYVKNTSGDLVPMSTLVDVKSGSGPEYTNRFNLLRSAEITGAPSPGYSSAQALSAIEEVMAISLPSDMTYAWNAMSFQEKLASGSSGVVFLFSLLFVYLILAAQYESWSLPLAILLGTPFAVFGAFFLLYLGRFISPTFENNVFTQISLVMLIGMAAKNAILIVEFAKLKFEEGYNLYDSAMIAAKDRYRPILMTAFSFILGVIPLITASGSGAESRQIMGVALLGGLGIATLLGVFFYPMFFIGVGKLFKYEQKRAKNPPKPKNDDTESMA